MGRDDPLSQTMFWHPRGGSGSGGVGGSGEEWWGTLPQLQKVSHLLPRVFEVSERGRGWRGMACA